MIKKAKKILLITFAILFSFALLMGGSGCVSEKPKHTVEYTLTLSSETVTLSLFEEKQVTAIAKQDGEIVTGAEVEWCSSATNVATVNNGLIVAVSCGSSEITATWQGKTATCNVVVEDDGVLPVLQVSESAIGLELLMTSAPYKVRPNVFYKDNAHNTSSATFTYSIAEEHQSVVTVNSDGYVTPVGVGTATLIVSAEWKGYSGPSMQKEVEIVVKNDVQVSLSGGTNQLSLFNGTIDDQTYSNTTTITATVKLNGVALTEPNITWCSSDENIATVEDGVITALNKGKAQIYYIYNDGEKEYLSDYFEIKTFSVQLTLEQSLGEAVLIENAKEVTNDFVFSFNGFNEQATTVTKAVTATGEELRASYDKTNKQLTIYNDKINGTADEYLQGVITPQDGGEYDLTIYTQENLCYDVKLTIISREITTSDGLTAFFNSYTTGAETDDETNVTCGTYVTLGADIENFTRSKAIQTDLETYFKGTFDGRGYAIKIDQSKEMWYKWGFFGRSISAEAVIKNTAFIGLLKNSSAGGGLAHVLAGVVDNCYVELTMNGSTKAQGGVCYKNEGTIKNTIVNVTSSASTTVDNKATLCCSGTENSNTDFNTCFSIGVADKVIYAAATKTNNVVFSADELKGKIGETLPVSYNAYWTYTESGLSFGNTQVLTFTAE